MAGRRFSYVISLCDKVLKVCPEFPDNPRLVHWSILDPATADVTERAGYPASIRTAAGIDTRVRYLPPLLAQTPQEVQP
jgi:hypothetical protein